MYSVPKKGDSHLSMLTKRRMAAVKSSEEDIRRGFKKGQAKACVEKGHAVSPRRGFAQAANLHIGLYLYGKMVTVTFCH